MWLSIQLSVLSVGVVRERQLWGGWEWATESCWERARDHRVGETSVGSVGWERRAWGSKGLEGWDGRAVHGDGKWLERCGTVHGAAEGNDGSLWRAGWRETMEMSGGGGAGCRGRR